MKIWKTGEVPAKIFVNRRSDSFEGISPMSAKDHPVAPTIP